MSYHSALLIKAYIIKTMKPFLKILFFSIFTLSLSAQKTAILRGGITDAETKDALVGASIVIKSTSRGAVTDLDGRFQLSLEKGSYALVISYVGYATLEQTIDLQSDIDLSFALSPSIVMKEVVVSADIAIDRKTPVAFSNIPSLKLKEELASQDIPMILNSTPGVYATQSGGGDGDARITIRGFNQRNVAVMVDGIPVNDMENGAVYWSNWFGLNLVTKTIQVQRGLGASKLSIPSIGGTLNILTKGFDAKRSLEVKQEMGAGGLYQTTLGFTTGRLKGNWGATGAFAYRKNDGWVDGNYTRAFFYFFRMDKEFGKHLLTLSGYGGPQEHGQRTFTRPIAQVNADLAADLAIPEVNLSAFRNNLGRTNSYNRGLRYNEAWGFYEGKLKTTRLNYYHKPQFNLRHSVALSKKTFLSNIAYLSIGNGGGTNAEGSVTYDSSGQVDFRAIYLRNTSPFISSASILRASINNHFWYGLLSTIRHEAHKNLSFSGGIDLRNYKGEHYRTIHDMLGGNRFIGSRNARIDAAVTPLSKGDRYWYDYDGFVRWAGGFGLAEYTQDNLTVFANASTAISQYKWHDKMFAKVVDINGRQYYTSNVSTRTPLNSDANLRLRVPIINGVMYTVDHPTQTIYNYAKKNSLQIDSTSARDQIIGWLNYPTFTFKTGASYNLNKNHTLFANAGYFNRPAPFSNAIDEVYSGGTNDRNGNPLTPELGKVLIVGGLENEKITAGELGYQYRSHTFSLNANAYYTLWRNRPVNAILVPEDPANPDSERKPAAINGIGARHMGMELDFAWAFARRWKWEGLVSIGDWIWDKEAIFISPTGDTTRFDPTGVYVGDAAQIQLGSALRFEPVKNAYVTARATYFGKNYSNFEPRSLTGINARRQSWQMPDYWLMDIHAGYTLRRKKFPTLDFRASLLNAFDTLYISDGNNNDTAGNTIGTQDFDAKSATVFFGLGRRWTVSLEISF